MKIVNYRQSVIAVIAIAIGINLYHATVIAEEKKMTLNKLTPEEERVIVHKGTEPPFSGKYIKHKDPGTYICRHCNTPLFRSDDKFESSCGWPGFDDEILGAVKRTVDADGIRTEITCTRCGAHLGHLFEGERFTEKNIRHCVNSISLDFIPADREVKSDTAYFAGGCFWGMEALLQELEGVIMTNAGYMGGRTNNPTYEEVCHGTTGHAETIEVIFDPTKISFEKLTKFFFEIHDPTQLNRQGPDIGSQYRSAVFYVNDDQKKTAEKLIETLKSKGYDVATEVVKALSYWKAEQYHQDYYKKTGKAPYCHFHQKRF